jgi:uncharacterized protein
VIVYADSSALVKLFVSEKGSDLVEATLARIDLLATVSIAFVEIWAAVVSAGRSGRVLRYEPDRLAAEIEGLWTESVSEIEIDSILVRRAAALARENALRGYDAVHLAGLIRTGPAGGPSFACWDRDLRDVAWKVGYALIPESLDE